MSQEVTFSDYLLCLSFYRKLDEKKFRPLLERVKPFAVRNPSDLAALVSWMNENGLAEDVVKWIDKLSKDDLAFPPVSIAVAATYANTKNWSRLRRWTGTGWWGDSDYLRIGYQAIATRKSRNGGTEHTEFEKLWRSAEQATNEQPERGLDLARLASKWNLENESEQLWLRVAKNPPMRREALDALRRLYRTNDNLEKLYDILQRLHESSPTEAPITADLARLGLNIQQDTTASHDLAKEAYDGAPNELNCAVTYAFPSIALAEAPRASELYKDCHRISYTIPTRPFTWRCYWPTQAKSKEQRSYIAAADAGKIYVEEKKLIDEAKSKLAAASATPSPAVSPAPPQLSPTPTSTSTPPLL